MAPSKLRHSSSDVVKLGALGAEIFYGVGKIGQRTLKGLNVCSLSLGLSDSGHEYLNPE